MGCMLLENSEISTSQFGSAQGSSGSGLKWELHRIDGGFHHPIAQYALQIVESTPEGSGIPLLWPAAFAFLQEHSVTFAGFELPCSLASAHIHESSSHQEFESTFQGGLSALPDFLLDGFVQIGGISDAQAGDLPVKDHFGSLHPGGEYVEGFEIDHFSRQ
mgnify:CR=1 FL=1